MDSSNNWSDFVATPPSLQSASPSVTLNDFLGNGIQAPSNFIISEDAVTNIFEQSVPPTPLIQQSPPPPPPMMQYQQPVYQQEYNEIENRQLMITNANPVTTLEEINQVFNVYSSIKTIDTANLQNGIFYVDYYDLRHAQQIKRMTNGTLLHGNIIGVVYAPLQIIADPRKPPNNGTIVVFHLPSGITNQHIETSFGQYGEIRQIRGTPTKPTQRFVEYWDTRAAEAALNGLSGKYVMGSRVSIEFSLPGGFRRNVQRPDQNPNQQSPTIVRVQK